MPVLNTNIGQITNDFINQLVEKLGYTKRIIVEIAIREFYQAASNERNHIMSIIARNRINSTPELSQHSETILYDWPNAEEHAEWVATAPVEEIVDWAETIEAQSG